MQFENNDSSYFAVTTNQSFEINEKNNDFEELGPWTNSKNKFLENFSLNTNKNNIEKNNFSIIHNKSSNLSNKNFINLKKKFDLIPQKKEEIKCESIKKNESKKFFNKSTTDLKRDERYRSNNFFTTFFQKTISNSEQKHFKNNPKKALSSEKNRGKMSEKSIELVGYYNNNRFSNRTSLKKKNKHKMLFDCSSENRENIKINKYKFESEEFRYINKRELNKDIHFKEDLSKINLKLLNEEEFKNFFTKKNKKLSAVKYLKKKVNLNLKENKKEINEKKNDKIDFRNIFHDNMFKKKDFVLKEDFKFSPRNSLNKILFKKKENNILIETDCRETTKLSKNNPKKNFFVNLNFIKHDLVLKIKSKKLRSLDGINKKNKILKYL